MANKNRGKSRKSTSKATTKRRTNAKSSTTRGGTRSRKPASKRKSSSSRTRKKTTRRKPKANFSLDWPQKVLIIGIVTIFATAVLVLSLLSPNQGQLTSELATLMWQLFGWGGYVIPLATGTIGLYLVLWGMDQAPTLPAFRLIGLILLFLAAEGLASLLSLIAENGLNTFWEVAEAQLGGGYVGGLMAYTFDYFIGDIGGIFTLVVIGFLGTILLSGLSRNEIGAWIINLFNRSARTITERPKRSIRINPGREPRHESGQPRQLPLSPELLNEDESETEEPKSTPRAKRKTARKTKPKPPEPAPQPTVVSPVFLGGGQPGKSSWTLPTITEMLESGSDSDTNDGAIREQVEIIEHTLESFGAPATVVEINQGPTITQFGVEPNYIVMRNGKRTKVKVGKIAGLADDIALALAARSIRIQAPVPGKGYVGIEVPNPAKALVSLRDVMESKVFHKIKSPLGIGLGQNVAGQPIVADLASMPHMLIAGTTGSGKSVLVNGIIACLLLQNTPDNLKLVMVDPKRVELTGYNGIPHLAAPVVVEMDRVISTLQWALREMDARYKMFANIGARNINDYNKKVRRKKDAEKMPYIVIIIDELADLMMLAPEDTERAITRLAQMARATGMHMVIATQRPSVDVVTGLIKANFPARVAFAVSSGTDSRVILDSTGAERLLGQGDMLFQNPNAPAPLRLQGCFVSDEELRKLISYWQRARRFHVVSAEKDAIPRSRATSSPKQAAQNKQRTASPEQQQAVEQQPTAKKQEPKTLNQAPTVIGKRPSPAKTKPKPKPTKSKKAEPVQQQPLWEALQEEVAKPEHSDELMPEAIALVRKLNKASTSLLQRRFRIGYTRAARMIDAMEDMNIIGPPTGTSKAREVISEQNASEKTDSENSDVDQDSNKS